MCIRDRVTKWRFTRLAEKACSRRRGLTMAWFSVWLPLVSQLVVPVSLLAWLAFGRHATKARTLVVNALVATYVVAIGIAGLWLVIPWWLPFAYGVVVVWTIARRLRGKDCLLYTSPSPRD